MLRRRNIALLFSSCFTLLVWSCLSCQRGNHVFGGVEARSRLAFSSTSSRAAAAANRLLTSKFTPRHFRQVAPSASRSNKQRRTTSASTGLNMFMGSEGGILGIGTPELLTILLVGYFVLGPSDLYKLTKEIGKFVQNIRTLGSDLTKTVENNLESQLQLDDLRKAQRELNDAFSFRRSINKDGASDEDDEAFGLRAVEKDDEGNVVTAASVASPAEATATAPAPVKKIRKRRVKKVVPVEDEAELAAAEQQPMAPIPNGGDIPDWAAPFADQGESEWAPRTVSNSGGGDDWTPPDYSGIDTAEQRKFQAQMDVEAWNAQVMAQAQQQQQQPTQEQQQQVGGVSGGGQAYQSFVLTKVMERLALLEEEKIAADALLQEEFRLRADTEEKYYREKRQILEEAVVELEEGSNVMEPARASSNSPSNSIA